MYHFYDVVINDNTGVPLSGVIIRLYTSAGILVPLFADEAGTTPIEAVSGIPDAAVTDGDGNYDFYVADGKYDLRFFIGDALLKVMPNIHMVVAASDLDVQGKAQAEAIGVAGSANDLGTFSTPLVDDNTSVKSALESVGSNLLSTDNGKGAGLSGFSATANYAAGTTGSRLKNDIYVTDAPFNAVGDNAIDCLAAFNAATAAAIAQGKRLVIPRGSYVLSGAWTVNFPIDIEADPSANLRWTNEASAGLVLDFRAASANFGLNNIRLGGVYSPAIDSTISFPGYPSSWSSSQRSSKDAITLMGGSRVNIEVQYAMGWNAEFRPKGTYDVTNGARAPLNINYYCNTGDLNTYGVYFDGGPANAASLGAVYVEWNTCFAKFPVYYDASLHSISQCNVRILGQCFTNEGGGAVVYGKGSNINTCVIDIPWVYAGYSAYDSPTGTPTGLTCPLLAGDVSSNGQLTDGNALSGYFGGSNNSIKIGLALDQAAFPGGRLPASGVVTRIRDAGINNHVTVNLYERSQGAAVALSATQGEANYGGGVGAASISRATLVSIEVPTMPNISANSFYFYNCLLSDGQSKPIRIVPVDSGIMNSKLNFAPKDNSANVNRECIVEITNLSGSSVAGATYFCWIIVDV